MITHIAVIDVGKTNVKLALVRAADLAEVAVVTRPNTVIPGPPYPHFDVAGHWDFLQAALADFHRLHGVDAIVTTTHGACGVLLGPDGRLAAPVMDYEFTGPDTLAEAYGVMRPPFADTGSPRLPAGLNLGAQVFWQLQTDPGLRERLGHIVTYPQYWGYLLTGVLATDVTSLGCHTDLWVPLQGTFSVLVDRLDIRDRLAPARRSDDLLGPLLPEVAMATGLSPETPVYCGIHDSNASLLPQVLGRAAPFSVVSTGTWVIAMAIGGAHIALDPARDTLINVNALGAPVPSARFMGGREYDVMSTGARVEPSADDIAAVLRSGTALMPSVVAGSGPYPDATARWVPVEPAPGSGQRGVALSFYLALMTATCLRLIGHRGAVVVEGPFARNAAYLAMLSAATKCPVHPATGATGTARGAAMLVTGPVAVAVNEAGPVAVPDGYAAYADRWAHMAG